MSAQNGDGLRLLIIDDDAAFCRLVRRVAERRGFEVIATDNPDSFKNAAQSWNPTLIVTDLNMPETDGIELLRDLAARGCRAPIVVASGIDERTLDAALRLGRERGLNMSGVLQKPVALEDLERLLARHQPLDDAVLANDLARAVAALRRGIEGDDPSATPFYLDYQPKVSSRLGRIAGAEALVRWAHPHLGLTRPDRFIRIAEAHDLIDPLTDWVFETAAAQAAAWQQQGLDLGIAVNVSAKNLRDIRFPDRLSAKCRECGVEPGRLTIEVTETSAMSDAVHMLDVLSRLRIKGFNLSLDDFGTGYSSLVQLRKMPFSELKIDLSFVTAMLKDKDSRFIVELTVDFARKLGLHSVAEGVESEAIWEALLALGCDLGQGFYLGRPMAPGRVAAAAIAAQAVHSSIAAAASV